MSIGVKYAGAWQEAASDVSLPIPFVKYGGVWKEPLEVWAKRGGVWELAWPESPPAGGGVVGADISSWNGADYYVYRGAGGLSAQFQFTIGSDGNVYTAKNGAAAVNQGAWLQTGLAASDYEVMATQTGGVTQDAGVLGDWSDLTGGQSWSAAKAPVGVADFTLTLQIRDKATLTVQSSASITIELEAGT